MEAALVKVGLPVKCRKCRVRGFIKPGSDYGGWYKSKLFWAAHLRWYCPEHAQIGQDVDERFQHHLETPAPAEVPTDTVDELYKLLD